MLLRINSIKWMFDGERITEMFLFGEPAVRGSLGNSVEVDRSTVLILRLLELRGLALEAVRFLG